MEAGSGRQSAPPRTDPTPGGPRFRSPTPRGPTARRSRLRTGPYPRTPFSHPRSSSCPPRRVGSRGGAAGGTARGLLFPPLSRWRREAGWVVIDNRAAGARGGALNKGGAGRGENLGEPRRGKRGGTLGGGRAESDPLRSARAPTSARRVPATCAPPLRPRPRGKCGARLSSGKGEFPCGPGLASGDVNPPRAGCGRAESLAAHGSQSPAFTEYLSWLCGKVDL